MSQEAERVYTINLGKVWLSPNNQRAKRAINMIREFAEHHMKTGQIKIDQELSEEVWKRGIRSPPRKIRVKMAKTDEGHVLVSTYEEEVKSEAKTEEKPKKKKAEVVEKPAEVKKPEPKSEVKPTKPEAKPEPKKAEKKPEKKPEPKKEAKPKTEKKAEKKSDEKKPAKKSK
jgi:large subunit ribosomal protein L31e